MRNNAELNSLIKRKEQYQKLYDDAVNTDLSFANEEKKYEVERIKVLYSQRIAKIDKQQKSLNYKDNVEEIQFEVPISPRMEAQSSHVEIVQPKKYNMDNRTTEEILKSISEPELSQKIPVIRGQVVRGQDIILCLNCNTFNKVTNKHCINCKGQVMKESFSPEMYFNITGNDKIQDSLSSLMISFMIPSQDKVLDIILCLAAKGLFLKIFNDKIPSAKVTPNGNGAAFIPAILVTTDNGVCLARTILGCFSCLIIYRLWRDIKPIQSMAKLVSFFIEDFQYTLTPIKKRHRRVSWMPRDPKHDKDYIMMNRAFVTRYRPIQIEKKREWLTEIEYDPSFSEQVEDLRESIYKMEKKQRKWVRKKKDTGISLDESDYDWDWDI